MPNMSWFLVKSALIGYAAALFLVCLLIYFNIANIGTLVSNSEHGYLAIFLLIFFTGQTFAGIQIGIALWLESNDDDDDQDNGSLYFRIEPERDLVPIPVRVKE